MGKDGIGPCPISYGMKIITSIKIDSDTKEKATKLAAKMGLSLSSVINASLKKFVVDRRVSFSVEPDLNKKSKALLREALSEIRDPKHLVGPFSNTADLKESLGSK